MFRRLLLAASLALALAVPAHAGSALREVLFSGPPCGGALNANGVCSSIDLNFAGNQVIINGLPSTFSSQLSISRAQTVSSYAATSGGVFVPFVANSLRITNQGLLVEETRSNDALWARDLTNAAWTKVNMTTAHTAVGADGVASSATTLTATAGNATVLQSITLGSQADTSSVYLQCVTCTGPIQITENNGTAWSTCANLITTGFVRCSVTATLANPIIGLRIVNSGDSVVADFFQMEPGSFATSPIPTTTIAVTRNADNITFAGLASTTLLGSKFSFVAAMATLDTAGTSAAFVSYDTTARIYVNSNTNPLARDGSGNALSATLGTGSYTGGATKTAYTQSSSGRSLVGNNGTVVTDTNLISGQVTVYLGNRILTDGYTDSYVQRFSIWNSRLSDPVVKALSQ